MKVAVSLKENLLVSAQSGKRRAKRAFRNLTRDVYFHSARQRVFVDRLGDVGSAKPRAGCTRLIPDIDRDTKRAKADHRYLLLADRT